MYHRDFEIFKNYCYLNAGQFSKLLDFYKSPDRIPAYSGKKSIVVDAASDPWSVDWVKDIAMHCKSSGVVSAFLINDKKFAEENQDLNFRFFPVWAYRYSQQVHQYTNRDFFSKRRSKRVSCLNRMPKLHRAYTYYLLKQLPWFDNIFLSFYGLKSDDRLTSNTVEITLDQINTALGSDIANFFASELINFPITHESEYQWTNCHDADTTAYTDCYSNICTESSYSNFCPTEKTFKCIATNTLIFPVSCANFVSLLSHAGIDINYAGIDLSTIDSTASWQLRAKLTIDLVDKLYYNIEDIWHSNKEQLLYNQQLLQSGRLEKSILLNIQDHL
jgi:hypothetical protein